MKVYSSRQLFIDDKFIQFKENIKLVVHQPTKTGEIVIWKNQSPHHRIGGYNSIIFDEGIYKLYYGETLYKEDGVYAFVCLATSTDGINFNKPSLGLAPHYHEKDNNIIIGFGAGGVKDGLGDGGCMVFIDPNDQKNKYKLLARHGLKRHMGLYGSSDGIHFKFEKEKVLDDRRFEKTKGETYRGFHLDSQNIIFYDETIKKYVTFVRRNYEIGGQVRAIARGESKSLDEFCVVEDMKVIIKPDEKDPQFFVEEANKEVPVIDYYTNCVNQYPFAADTYVMFPGMYFKYNRFIDKFSENKPMNAGPIDTFFAASRDGIDWDFYDRKPFIRLGEKHEFDAYAQYMVHGIVPGNGNNMYLYYMGSDIIHGYGRGDQYEERENKIIAKANLKPTNNVTAISRLVMRRDGFVSASAGYQYGSIKTPILIFNGNQLLINVDTSATGFMKIEIRDEHNKPISGFTINDCDMIHTTNDINKIVTWNDLSDVSSLQEKEISLYFHMFNCDLYAFEFTNKLI
ncbi:MAG: hypothetical protein KAG94_00390 [Clostridiales bacterium]|nr:hypothetical protein [Clostridiales bacterium]